MASGIVVQVQSSSATLTFTLIFHRKDGAICKTFAYHHPLNSTKKSHIILRASYKTRWSLQPFSNFRDRPDKFFSACLPHGVCILHVLLLSGQDDDLSQVTFLWERVNKKPL